MEGTASGHGRHEDMNQDEHRRRTKQVTERYYDHKQASKRHQNAEYEVQKARKGRLSGMKSHKKGALIRYNSREDLAFLDADDTREN